MKLSPLELDLHYEAWLKLSRRERGDFTRTLSESTGVNRSTLYRQFEARQKGIRKTSRRSDRQKARATDAEYAHEYARKVAAMKIQMATQNEKSAKTEMVVRALFNAGEVSKIFPVSTVNRWLNWYGLAYRQIRNYRKTTDVRMTTTAPNKVWFLDSSTSEIYYLREKSGRIVRNTDGILTDKNHREEILTKKGYAKVLIFCAVDMYSGAYHVLPQVTPGESASAWVRFILDIIMAKDDPRIPFRGIPENIYVDKGSGLENGIMKEMLESLGIKVWTHKAGNAKAKGRVESRIGHYKNSIERCLAFENVESLDRYREIITPMIIADNTRKGFYSKWMEIYTMPGALRELSADDRSRLGYSSLERQVNVRGCVKIDGVEYLVSRRISKEYVTIFTLVDGTRKAVDRHGCTYELKSIESQYREFGTYKASEKSDYDRDLDAIDTLGKELRQSILSEHFREELPENVMPIQRKGETAEIQTAHEPSGPSTPADAWLLIYNTTGFRKKDLAPDYAAMLTRFFEEAIAAHGEVPSEKLTMIIDDLTTNTITEGIL